MARSTLVPRIAHAIIVGGAALGTFVATKNEFITGIVVTVISPLAGELLARIRPSSRRLRKLSPGVMQQLEKLQLAANGDIHDAVNLLAAIRGQMALTNDAFRRILDELQAVEDDPGGF